MSDYNGWRNRATWLINIWYNPETKADVDSAKEDFESQIDSLSSMLRDFIDDDIDWDELRENMDDEEEDEEEEDE